MAEHPHIAGFEMLEYVGQGSTGAVYKARQEEPGRIVALKILHAHIRKDAARVERIRKEAEASAQLSHPNLIEIYDIREEADSVFIVMEYVEGHALADRMRDGTMFREEDALLIAERIASALEYLWVEARIPHCNLNPGAIMLSGDGTVKVSGPKMVNVVGLNPDNAMAVNPRYMAPEVAKGGASIDQRADIYSLGALLYHMTTGKPPFDGATVMEVIRAVLKGQIRDPMEENAELSECCAWLIEKMMAKTPGGRPQDWPAVLEDIEQVQVGHMPLGTLPAPGESAITRSRDRRPPMIEPKEPARRLGASSKVVLQSGKPKATEPRARTAVRRPAVSSSFARRTISLLALLAVGAVACAYFAGGDLAGWFQKVKDGSRTLWVKAKERPGFHLDSSESGAGTHRVSEGRAGLVTERGGSTERIAVAPEMPVRESAGAVTNRISGRRVGLDTVRLLSGKTVQGKILSYSAGSFSVLCMRADGPPIVSQVGRGRCVLIEFAPGARGTWQNALSGKVQEGPLVRVETDKLVYLGSGGAEESIDFTRLGRLVTNAGWDKVESITLRSDKDLGAHLAWGRVTLFMFWDRSRGSVPGYDARRATAMLRKHLEKRARETKDLYLRVVELTGANDSLRRTLDIPFVPSVLVYDGGGARIGNANASPLMIDEYIKAAR